MYAYRVTFINDHGQTVTREVTARHGFEAVQLAKAFNKFVLSVINCDL